MDVLISGYGDVELEQRGAYAFLHKAVDPDTFFCVVNRAVLRAQMRRKPEHVLGDDSVWIHRPWNRFVESPMH